MCGRRVAVVVVAAVVVAAVADMVTDEDRIRHNYATTRRRSSAGWVFPEPRGERRTIFQRLWREASPQHPEFPPDTPSSRWDPIQPRLLENDFVTEDDDYDVDTNPLWLPQSRFSQRPASLESLQHLLEGEVAPVHLDQISLGDVVATTGDEATADTTLTNRDGSHRKHYMSDNDVFPSYDAPNQPDVPVQLPLSDLKNLDSPGVASPDVLSQLNVEGDLINHSQFPGNFLSQPPRFVDDDGRDTLLGSSFLAPVQYPPSLSEQEPFLKNLFSEGQLPASLGKENIFSSVHNHPDYPDPATISDIFNDQESFPEFPQHNTLIDQNDQEGHFQEYPLEQHQNIAVGESRGPEWFPSPAFQLPSSKDLITAYTNPELTQEGQREACHARMLHTCGGRVIAEFNQQPKYLEPCRIREEFLDCVELERGRPCEVRGPGFNREDARRIKDEVKTLLWSARGCILGHSA